MDASKEYNYSENTSHGHDRESNLPPHSQETSNDNDEINIVINDEILIMKNL